MDELTEIVEQRIRLARNDGRMSTLSEITALLSEAIREEIDIKQFGEIFVRKFCQPSMKDTLNIIRRLADMPVENNGKFN